MKKIYFLSTCSTCTRIINDLGIKNLPGFIFQDIKHEKITERQLNEMAQKAGNFEVLFSKKSMKYKVFGLQDKLLSESDYKNHILEEYTFLKRPVILLENAIYVGNSKEAIHSAKQHLERL